MSERLLPPDDLLRGALHDEVHARPTAHIELPARVVYVALLNQGVSLSDELAHLALLPGVPALQAEPAQGANFMRLGLAGGASVKWERHTEYTRWSLVLPAAEVAGEGVGEGEPLLPEAWLRALPGRTLAALQLNLRLGPIDDPAAVLAAARGCFGDAELLASRMGEGHSCVVTDLRVGADGFERMEVVLPPGSSPTRAGRVSQRLLELETYRLMALRGLPVAKALASDLGMAEGELAAITAELENQGGTDAQLLQRLSALAARVERATAEHGYRFSATQAYHAIVRQRLAELRELRIPGTQTLGEFMQRRLSPAMATVDSTAQRLGALSQRIERALALLRTRVDIATEAQNQQLLAKLTRGQELQLKLQSTVEGLSIAAISYYVVSLVLYGAKAAKGMGVPLNPELVAGLSIAPVLWAVWALVQRIHRRLHREV